MKPLRIIWSLILLVAILASLTGCGTKPTPTVIPGVTPEASLAEYAPLAILDNATDLMGLLQGNANSRPI